MRRGLLVAGKVRSHRAEYVGVARTTFVVPDGSGEVIRQHQSRLIRDAQVIRFTVAEIIRNAQIPGDADFRFRPNENTAAAVGTTTFDGAAEQIRGRMILDQKTGAVAALSARIDVMVPAVDNLRPAPHCERAVIPD